MKKISISVLLVVILLTGCQNKQKDKLEGIWQLRTLEINGTVLQGSSLGNWKWEFNEEGGYLTDVAGVREKGLYTLKESTLTLKSVTHKERPEHVLNIVHLDSLQLDLLSADEKNKSSLHFLKMKENGVVEND
jgi:hypothetical protein